MTGPARLQGVRRWEEWLEGRLSPNGIVLEDAEEFETSDAVWRIEFRDGTRAKLHVTDRALRLSREESDQIIDLLETVNWLRLLNDVKPGGIRVQADGGLEEVGPQGAGNRHE